MLETAINDNESQEASEIRSLLDPLIKIIGTQIPWSEQERSATLGKLYSLMHLFSAPTHFITISPQMRNQALVLKICLQSQDNKFKKQAMKDVCLRSKLAVEHPVITVEIFYRIMRKFFEILVQMPLSDFNGKNCSMKNVLKRYQSTSTGIFGLVKAHYGVIESQSGGSLHYHGLLFGSWNLKTVQSRLHEEQFQKEFLSLIDSHITCRISSEQLKQDKLSKNLKEVPINEPIPTMSSFKDTLEKLAVQYNHHNHTFTCWKKENKHCRMAQPQAKNLMTRCLQLIEGPDNQPIEVPLHAPVASDEGATIFSIQDERIIIIQLARVDEFEQYMVELNPETTVLLRCNTSMQILATLSQAKASMYYIAKYVSKTQFELRCVLSLLKQVEQEYEKYGSVATDAGSASRKAKNILQKMLNQQNLVEISDQQAIACLLGYPSALSSHMFTFVYPWEAVRYYQQSIYGINANEKSFRGQFDVVEESNERVSISEHEMYINRGSKLAHLNLYCYSAVIVCISKPKTRTKRKKQSTGVGRPSNGTFLFRANSIPSKCRIQSIRSVPRVPRISGNPPPKYPGDPPDWNTKQWTSWNTKAKQFVEYYSLLFLPLNHEGQLMSPFDNILPWANAQSWNNFWTVVSCWNGSEVLYEQLCWRVFCNMVDNLRYKESKKNLVTKFRFANADTRTHQLDKSSRDADVSNERFDELTNIIAELQTKHGLDLFSSAEEKERMKRRDYVHNQISHYASINISTEKHEIKVPIPELTFDQCNDQCYLDLISSQLDGTIETSLRSVTKVPLQCSPTLGTIVLNKNQRMAVNMLHKLKRRRTHVAFMKRNQFLAYLQGDAGAGKTTTIKKLGYELNLRILFSGTTNTAAAQLNASTINELFNLGKNVCDFTNVEISLEKTQKILQRLQGIDLIVIDEVSMMTPVTLAKIDATLQLVLCNKYIFGGLDVILIGDMCQFPPVEKRLKHPALWQAAIRYSRCLQPPNRAYGRGSELFIKFIRVMLRGQMRANAEWEQIVSKVRNFEVEYPITDEWLDQLIELSSADFDDRKSTDSIDWKRTSIAVTTNYERHEFIRHKIQEFGQSCNQPILQWKCPVQLAQGVYETLSDAVSEHYNELYRYFVVGAPCILTDNIDTAAGLAKNKVGFCVKPIWKHKKDEVNLERLPAGEITTVSQPDYILVLIDQKFVVVKWKYEEIKIRGVKRKYKTHGCDIAAAITFHKLQGETLLALILSLNSVLGVSRKILPISLHSIYTGISRVRCRQALRILPLTATARQQLKKLQWDPDLKTFMTNYDENGKWKLRQLRSAHKKRQQCITMELAMLNLESLTSDELLDYVRKLDLIPEKKRIEAYKKVLQEPYEKGQIALQQDNGSFRRNTLNNWRLQLRKEHSRGISKKRLRHFARKFQIKGFEKMSESQLIQALNLGSSTMTKRKYESSCHYAPTKKHKPNVNMP